MTRVRNTARRKNPDTVLTESDERYIVAEAKGLIRASKRLSNKGTSYRLVLDDGPAWVLQTERIGDVVYAVVKRGREVHYFTVMDLNDRSRKASKKVENPSRGPIDHKFAGSLFSAGHPKTALAYLRGTLTKSTARELAAGKKRR